MSDVAWQATHIAQFVTMNCWRFSKVCLSRLAAVDLESLTRDHSAIMSRVI